MAGFAETAFWEEMTGAPLDAKAVEHARNDEIRDYSKRGAYETVTIDECWKKSGKTSTKVTKHTLAHVAD